MNTAPTRAGTKRFPAKVWPALLLLPVLAYAAMMIQAVLPRRDNLPFGRFDLAVLVLVLAYCCAGMLLAWRRSEYLPQFVT